MSLTKIIKTWINYPSILENKSFDDPQTSPRNTLLGFGYSFLEATLAGGVTYLATKKPLPSVLIGCGVLLTRFIQACRQGHKNYSRY